MNLSVLAALLATTGDSTASDQKFLSFVAKYGKNYGTREEYEYRAALFNEHLKFVEAHNAGDASFTVTVNKFSDWSRTEKERLLGFKPHGGPIRSLDVTDTDPANDIIRDDVNWDSAGKVSMVRDQGTCGSDYAFAAIGAVESAYALQFRFADAYSLSSQQLVDCSQDFGNHGCDGGDFESSFKYLESAYATS